MPVPTHPDLSVFALETSQAFGTAVCKRLGVSLSPHETRSFDDGEHKPRPLASVRGIERLHTNGSMVDLLATSALPELVRTAPAPQPVEQTSP